MFAWSLSSQPGLSPDSSIVLISRTRRVLKLLVTLDFYNALKGRGTQNSWILDQSTFPCNTMGSLHSCVPLLLALSGEPMHVAWWRHGFQFLSKSGAGCGILCLHSCSEDVSLNASAKAHTSVVPPRPSCPFQCLWVPTRSRHMDPLWAEDKVKDKHLPRKSSLLALVILALAGSRPNSQACKSSKNWPHLNCQASYFTAP